MIYTESHNEDFVEMAETVRLKLAPFRRSQLATAQRIEQSDAENSKIVDAIVERGGPTAGKALRRHLLSAALTMRNKRNAKRAGKVDMLSQAS
jgi:DNA-binding FadR family transcriptional regulator